MCLGVDLEQLQGLLDEVVRKAFAKSRKGIFPSKSRSRKCPDSKRRNGRHIEMDSLEDQSAQAEKQFIIKIVLGPSAKTRAP